jgi:hypothetical protein
MIPLARADGDRRQSGDSWTLAPLLGRLAFEGGGLHDSDTPAKLSRGTP